MNEINNLRNMAIIDWLFTGFIIMCCLVTLFTIVTKFLEYIGKPIKWFKRQNDEHDLLVKLVDDFNEFKGYQEKRNEAIMQAQMESMCDRIEQKCKFYIAQNGIPEDEYDSFVRLFNAYRGINGNHGAEAKFNYCIKNLKIIPGAKYNN